MATWKDIVACAILEATKDGTCPGADRIASICASSSATRASKALTKLLGTTSLVLGSNPRQVVLANLHGVHCGNLKSHCNAYHQPAPPHHVLQRGVGQLTFVLRCRQRLHTLVDRRCDFCIDAVASSSGGVVLTLTSE